jgi:hypothetical protein
VVGGSAQQQRDEQSNECSDPASDERPRSCRSPHLHSFAFTRNPLPTRSANKHRVGSAVLPRAPITLGLRLRRCGPLLSPGPNSERKGSVIPPGCAAASGTGSGPADVVLQASTVVSAQSSDYHLHQYVRRANTASACRRASSGLGTHLHRLTDSTTTRHDHRPLRSGSATRIGSSGARRGPRCNVGRGRGPRRISHLLERFRWEHGFRGRCRSG